jgi:predicted ATPase
MSNPQDSGTDQGNNSTILSDHPVYVHQIKLSDHPFINDVCIDTHNEKKHIIITGKNGIGKSTLLHQIKSAIHHLSNRDSPNLYLYFRHEYLTVLSSYKQQTDPLKKQSEKLTLDKKLSEMNQHSSFCDLLYNNQTAVDMQRANQAVQAFFNAKRTTEFANVTGVSPAEVIPQQLDQPLAAKFKQHLVNSRSQFAFAQVEGEEEEALNLDKWFKRLNEFMSDIFDAPMKLKFDRKTLDYKIESQDGSQLDFSQLSEGYSAIINVVSEIIMRMEAIEHGNFTLPGIVLIDEIETHLHVQLQKKVLRLLTQFFPNIQFIVTTHSPFVLTSLEDAVIFDMQTNTCIDAKEDLWQYSYEDILEGYFDTETYSLALEKKITHFEVLNKKDKATLSVKENKELLLLRNELKDVPTFKLADIELRLQALGIKR